MAKIKTHIEDCKQVLGEGYEEVHRWLDHFAKEWNPSIHLEYHRQFRHHAEGVKEAGKKWGYYSEVAAKLHIIRDCYMYIPYFDINTLREDMIEDLYLQALKVCHPIPQNEDWKND